MCLVLLPATALADDTTNKDTEDDKLKVTGQVRSRGEHRDEGVADRKIFLRTRLKLEATPTADVTAVMMVQDSRVYGAEPSTAADLTNLDLHLGYLQLQNLAEGKLKLQLGRMEISYGNQRLLGAFAWHNVGRSFDAARAIATPTKELRVDAFWAKLHQDRTTMRPLGDDLAGVYAMFKKDKLAVDAYGLYLYDKGGFVDSDGDGVADMDRFPGGGRFHLATAGARLHGTFAGAVKVNAEGAVQFGKRGDDLDTFAFAAHAAVDYIIPAGIKPSIGIGANIASGDSDPADSKWGTFENLFPTNHLHYGYIDVAAWKNLVDVFARVNAVPTKGLKVQVTGRMLQRLEENDTFYRASGAALVDPVAARATSAKAVGTEIDLLVKWVPRKRVALLAGFSYLIAGEFLDDTRGGDADNLAFGYIQLVGGF